MLVNAKFFLGRLWVPVFLAVCLAITGCESQPVNYPDINQFMTNSTGTNASQNQVTRTDVTHTESIILREGDVLNISFPTAPNLNSTKIPILRDGTVNLPVVGVVQAAGKTPAQFREDLLKLYANEIQSKQITVELVTESFPVFVTGAVLKPGKVQSDRPMTALDAIMEAGGPDYSRANLKSVTVLRRVNGHMQHYALNLKDVMTGKGDDQFYLKAGDIIYVRERFNWF